MKIKLFFQPLKNFKYFNNCLFIGRLLSTTVNNEEVLKFANLSNKWWNEQRELGALHSLNHLRIPLIRKALSSQNVTLSKPLVGLHVLDVGCGAGILSEPLARLGADVTGLDACFENIKAAEIHLKRYPLLVNKIKYKCLSIEDYSSDPNSLKFDAIILSEILEHVENLPEFIKYSILLLKPNASLIVTTINKTALSYAMAIFAAENIFRIVPRGTHVWDKFVPLNMLQELLTTNDMQIKMIHGMALNPITLKWCWISNPSVNYALHAVKNPTTST